MKRLNTSISVNDLKEEKETLLLRADTTEEKSRFLDNLFEEYHNLDYEDVIGGGSVKTRFRYTNVPKADFGLTEEEIFLLDDNKLN